LGTLVRTLKHQDAHGDRVAAVQELRRCKGAGISDAGNELVRRGLARPEVSALFRQRTSALGLPHRSLDDVAGLLDLLLGLVRGHRLTGSLVSDAHLAALALEQGVALWSTDADFARFDGLVWHDPLRDPRTP
jgi:predicted nucleic acid-binding protein